MMGKTLHERPATSDMLVECGKGISLSDRRLGRVEIRQSEAEFAIKRLEAQVKFLENTIRDLLLAKMKAGEV